MNYKRMLSKLLSNSEFESFADPLIEWDDNNLYRHLVAIGVVSPFDWKHTDESSICLFVDGRMSSFASLGVETIGITPNSATEMYNEIHSNGGRDFVSFILRFYNKALAGVGLKLMTIDRQDDCYHLVLVKVGDAPKLKRIKSDFWQFRELG